MAEHMHSGNARARFNYANDIGILGIGRTKTESAAAAQREVDSLLGWSQRNAVEFDTAKSEVVQFPGRLREEPVAIKVNGTVIEPAEYISWLGIYLDSKLSFKHHLAMWSAKAMKIAQLLRRLNPVKGGAAPGPLVTVVDACVVPVATCGADVWWPGITRPARNGVSTPQATNLCHLIYKAIQLALIAALPVWRTTPNAVLHREARILPARILLESSRLRFAARLKSLDDRHPLRSRASTCPNEGTLKYKSKRRISKRPETQKSRVQLAYRPLPKAEPAEPLLPAV